eukprot:COSAG04_NODE_6613_length_1292_cov_1.658843_2_plen_101_part_00
MRTHHRPHLALDLRRIVLEKAQQLRTHVVIPFSSLPSSILLAAHKKNKWRARTFTSFLKSSTAVIQAWVCFVKRWLSSLSDRTSRSISCWFPCEGIDARG